MGRRSEGQRSKEKVLRRHRGPGSTEVSAQICSPQNTARASVTGWVTSERRPNVGLGRINFLSIAQNSLGEMGRRQVLTVGNVDEIRKCNEKQPKAELNHCLTK